MHVCDVFVFAPILYLFNTSIVHMALSFYIVLFIHCCYNVYISIRSHFLVKYIGHGLLALIIIIHPSVFTSISSHLL